MKKLEITEDRIRAAATSCPYAKRVLEQLFPEVFEIFKGEPFNYERIFPAPFPHISVRKYGNYKDRALWLDTNYNWSLVPCLEEPSAILLVPTKKGM